MSLLDLVRPDLRAFAGYGSARKTGLTGSVWLNANECAWPNPADASARCNRYPAPQPAPLRDALAELYGVDAAQLLIGRGSDEAIDLLIRALCRPQQDAIVISTPVFGMYEVGARLQAAPVIDVPLHDGEEGFSADLSAIAEAAERNCAHLVFLCSPSNPTGQALSLQAIAQLAQRLSGKALIVVDEAYVEFSDVPSATGLMAEHANIAVLRTLSKAHALAAARIGVLIAQPELIAVLRNCQAPYPLPTPCVELALAALHPAAQARTRERIAQTRSERERLAQALAKLPGVRRVHPSQGNFLLVRFHDAQGAFDALLRADVVVRDQRAAPCLHDALRISIGAPDENDAVISALTKATEIAA